MNKSGAQIFLQLQVIVLSLHGIKKIAQKIAQN